MLGSLIRVSTAKGTPLVGMWYEPSTTSARRAVIHLHGSLGNFSHSAHIDYFAEYYTARGYAFLTANTSGHDYLGITERFEDCVGDLETWLKVIWARGYADVLMQGHSLGALKLIYTLGAVDVATPKVSGVILLSPFDIVAFYCHNDVDSRASRLETAHKVAQEDPDTVMPPHFWSAWPISAGTYINLIGNTSAADVFRFREGIGGAAIRGAKWPIYVAIGGNDTASYPSPQACVDQFSGLESVSAEVIEGAPHDFTGKEQVLLTGIEQWIATSLDAATTK